MSIKLKILFAGLLLSLCGSCDRGIPFSLTSPNFVWSERSTYPLYRYVSAYHCNDGKQYWVVLRCKGSGQLGGSDWLVLLCLKEDVSGTLIVYQLQHGLALLTYGLAKNPSVEGEIVRLRILDDEFFHGESCSGRIVLAYNGKVFGKSNFDDGTDKTWLRFEVKPRKNTHKVVSIVRNLYPLLEKEEQATDVRECLTPLLDTQRK